jgi:hypothetical protein
MCLLWLDCKTSPVATERKLPLLSVFRSKTGGEVVALAPDLIVVDDLWRDGQTSWALLQWLMLDQRTRHIPVIVLTGGGGAAWSAGAGPAPDGDHHRPQALRPRLPDAHMIGTLLAGVTLR